MINFHRLESRAIVLLEVLIAFALVALCVLPLIYPHVVILRSEKAFVATVELDHVVNLLFANRLQKLYLNEIPWSDIEEEKELPIDESILRQVDYKGELPFTGIYKFVEVRHKPPKADDKTIYLFDLEFVFMPNKGLFPGSDNKSLTYKYQVMIERKQK